MDRRCGTGHSLGTVAWKETLGPPVRRAANPSLHFASGESQNPHVLGEHRGLPLGPAPLGIHLLPAGPAEDGAFA